MHGAGGGGWEWEAWRNPLQAAGFEFVARDLEPSAAGLSQTRLEDYVQQVVEWGNAPSTVANGAPDESRLVLLGASMGGAVALRAAEALSPDAVVLVNAMVPSPWAEPLGAGEEHPDVIAYAGKPLASTARALPDCSEEVQRWACARWRDESGAVMDELRGGRAPGSAGDRADRPACRVLFVVGGSDDAVPAKGQLAWARAWRGEAARDVSSRTYSGMGHVGPLMGTRSGEVAAEVVRWLGCARSHTGSDGGRAA